MSAYTDDLLAVWRDAEDEIKFACAHFVRVGLDDVDRAAQSGQTRPFSIPAPALTEIRRLREVENAAREKWFAAIHAAKGAANDER